MTVGKAAWICVRQKTTPRGVYQQHLPLLKEMMSQPAAKQLTFAADMKPIFEATCTSCHGAKKSKAGLKMDTLEGVLKGTKKGNFVVPGKSAESRLVKIVESIAAAAKDPDGKTKALHKKGVKPMTPDQIAQIKKWIDQGAR